MGLALSLARFWQRTDRATKMEEMQTDRQRRRRRRRQKAARFHSVPKERERERTFHFIPSLPHSLSEKDHPRHMARVHLRSARARLQIILKMQGCIVAINKCIRGGGRMPCENKTILQACNLQMVPNWGRLLQVLCFTPCPIFAG